MIHIENNNFKIESREGESILASLTKAGLIILSPCGGMGLCGKCKVKLLFGKVSGSAPDKDGNILSCRSYPDGDIGILLPEEDYSKNELTAESLPIGSEIANADIALDIGTTTISAYLVDTDKKVIADTAFFLNPQAGFGADVMSRIKQSADGKTNALFKSVNLRIKRLIDDFSLKFKIENLDRLIVSGNTTMLHLFINANPSGMGQLPFAPLFTQSRTLSGKQLNLNIKQVVLLPSVSAFIGADIVSGLSLIYEYVLPNQTALLIDIGTNGEMALIKDGGIHCCSVAAGPALEGAGIECGMGGIKGAVSKVAEKDQSLSYEVIGGKDAVGICGCGLIDAVALMLKRKYIDETGAADKQKKDAYFDGEKFLINNGVYVSAKDVRQFQLAKSAIMTGIEILKEQTKTVSIDKVFIAGGLGFFIDVDNAITTGLLPKEFKGKINVCGNLSLLGAKSVAMGERTLEYLEDIKQKCSVIDLVSSPNFTQKYMDNMFFD